MSVSFFSRYAVLVACVSAMVATVPLLEFGR